MAQPSPDAVAAAGPDTIIRVYATPRAGRSEVAGERRGAVWVRLAAPPVGGAANQALLDLLSARLGVPRSAVHLQAGASGRQKVVRVLGMASQQVASRLGLVLR